MATDTLLTPSIISKETLVLLVNNLVMAGRVNRQFEEQMGAKIGTQLTVRKPNKFIVSEGAGLQVQDIIEPSTSITISNQSHVDFQFGTAALTLVVEEFRERYAKPAMEKLANRIDRGVLANIPNIYNEVGTPTVTPASFSPLAAVAQRLDEEAAPQQDRTLVLNPKAYWAVTVGISTVFVQSVAEPGFKGFIPNIANFEIFLDQNVPTQITGAYGAGSPTVFGSGQTGSTLVTANWPASITGLLNVGDVFTLAGVNAVNPESLASTGSLRNFVVTATANSSGAGASSLSIYPPIVTTGAYQTVDASPISGAAITVISGAAGSNLAKNIGFTRDCFGLVTVPLIMPDGVDFKAQENYKGINLRVIRDYDINNDVLPTRIDVMWGTATYYPELGCRLTN
jgi:hypothetical protein